MLGLIKEINCSGDEAFYTAFLKYLAQIVKGEKKEVIIYQKLRMEGIGKSTLTEFIRQFVLGLMMSV